MARDVFRDVAVKPDANGVLSALAGIQVTANNLNADGTTGSLAAIYQTRDGAAQGGTPASGSTGTNPITTGATGSIEFFANPGEYIISIHDTQAPARINDRTLIWNSMPAAAGGLPTSVLVADGGLNLGHLAQIVMNQMIQLGQVSDWWRPTPDIAVPSGFAIADGSQVQPANHDFGGTAAGTVITLPDLRNKFILGSDSTKADGAAAINADGPANAPGIGGTGGSMTHALTTGEMPVHNHPVSDPGHGHGISDPGHSHAPIGWDETYPPVASGNLAMRLGRYITNWGPGGTNGGTDTRGTGITVQSHTTGVTVGNTGSGAAHTNTPGYVGLLKIIKIKRI